MVWTLGGSGGEAHHSHRYSFWVSRTHTHNHSLSLSLSLSHPPLSPSLFIHSLTLGDALLHSSLPGAVKKAREAHKSKLKCSSECFLDMMHGSWDAAWPCCYTCKCADTHRPHIHNTEVIAAQQKKKKKTPSPLALAFFWPSTLLQHVSLSPEPQYLMCVGLCVFKATIIRWII